MILDGILSVLTPMCLLWCFFGTAVGIIFGAIPGLSAVMAMVLFLPLSFGMDPTEGIALLLGLYVGGISGGMISAILLKIPGTPASMCTVFDGGPMADRGEAGKALGIGVLYSFIGGIISAIALIFISPGLANIALQFSPYEYCSIAVMSLMIIASLSGKSMVNGLISGALGLLTACIGISPIGNIPRLTFGNRNLLSGVSMVPLLIGLFAVCEILQSVGDANKDKGKKVPYKMKGLGVNLVEFKDQFINMVRSAVIGVFIGILPGLGANTSSLLAYGAAKSSSKYPEKFGKGYIGGVVASETANNANTGGAIIPLLTLGIPGNTPTALLLAALTVHGVTPGPLIFDKNGALVYAIFTAFILANIYMLLLEWRGIKFFVKMLDIPKYIMYSIIIALCMVGTYSDKSRPFDILLVVVVGILAYFLKKFGFTLAPYIIGFILGPILESNLGMAVSMSGGSLRPFITRPISCGFLIVTVFSLIYVIYKNVRKEKNIFADE